MSDIFDYLNWRGDLSFNQSPLNEADYIIFSRLSYLPFERLVLKKDLTLINYLSLMEKPFLLKNDENLIEFLKTSNRFNKLRVRTWVYDFNIELVKQFFAITLFDENNNAYISFRGTDSTIIGWQEDFRMSYQTPVQAQLDAKKYYEEQKNFKYYFLFGHSKGGNLASYVYFTSKEKQKIKSVVNLDGPGFQASKIKILFKDIEKEKIHYFVPQGSVVGRLLYHEVAPVVVYSTKVGIFQHDSYSWKLDKTNFVRDENITFPSKIAEKTINEWVVDLSPEEQEIFVDNLFSLFGTGGERTLKDVKLHLIKNLPAMRIKLSKLDDNTKSKMKEIFKLLLQATKSSILHYNQERKKKNQIETTELDQLLED